LLDQIAMSPHFVGIEQAPAGGDWETDTYNNPGARLRGSLNGPNGAGTSSTVHTNIPASGNVTLYNGAEPWMHVPSDVALYHELNHARQATRGEMQPGQDTNPWVGGRVNNRELEATGLGQFADSPFSENSYRAARGLPLREYY
jgi:hypothetical protein